MRADFRLLRPTASCSGWRSLARTCAGTSFEFPAYAPTLSRPAGEGRFVVQMAGSHSHEFL
jgi:hypothetical protein